MNNRKLTILDIASALNVSKSTVSRALRDAYDIKPETRKKVMEYIRKMDYQPDFFAQNLKSRKSKTIGIIVPAYSIPFFPIAISGIQDYASKQGYNIMICHSNEQCDLEIQNIEALLAANVDGMIISVARDTEKNEHIRRLRKKGVPLVLFNRVIENLKVAKVVVDDYYGAFKMVKYLINTGCARIAHIAGPSNIVLSMNRRAGYFDALKEANLEIRQSLIRDGDFTVESGMECMTSLLESKEEFDAVFCVCDTVAFGAMKILKDYGKKIPDEISIAGFTNEPMAGLIEPSLTTVKQPIYQIGENAAKMLFAQIRDPNLPAEICVMETELVIRNSTRKLPT